MLDEIKLDQQLSREAFRTIRDRLRKRLLNLEQAAFKAKLPSIILFEGWDAAGKGASIEEITRRLDPRGFKVYHTQAPRSHELKMPWLWRYWMQIPRFGQMAIFDRSWYGRVTIERAEKITPMEEWLRAYKEINNFERTLAADGTVFMKFFLHISEEEQLRRCIRMSEDPVTAWQISQEDWARHQKYDKYFAAYKDMLVKNHTEHAPWFLIPANDPTFRMYSIYLKIIAVLEEALGKKHSEWPSVAELNQLSLEIPPEGAQPDA